MKIMPYTSFILLLVVLLTACQDKTGSSEPVSYAKQVTPILQTHCLKCHNKQGEGYKASGLSMETYSDLMAGTKFGPVIVPGNSISSTLVRVISGKADPAITMPHGGMQLMKNHEIKTIENWIDQGAKDN